MSIPERFAISTALDSFFSVTATCSLLPVSSCLSHPWAFAGLVLQELGHHSEPVLRGWERPLLNTSDVARGAVAAWEKQDSASHRDE